MNDRTTEYGAPETVKLLASLIETEMGLKAGIVQIYNQDRRLPAAKGFFIDLAILSATPFAVNRSEQAVAGQTDMDQVQTINQQELIQIDIFSYDDSARLKKLGINFALTSTAAQQLCEKWSFNIARIPSSFVDVSEVEASKRLNRYALTIVVTRGYQKTQTAPTFTVFQNPPTKLVVNP